MEKFGLPTRTINDLLNYFSTKPEIEKVLIFGSRAKGTYHNGSDIDFAILSNEDEHFFRIAGELDDLPTPYKFDVINYNTITHEGIKKSIDVDGVIFYQKNKAF